MGKKSLIWRQIAQIAAGQHGNVSREQLLGVGMGKDALYYAVKTARLHRVHHGVYAVGRPPTGPLEKAAAAVLACGPRAALSHGSAMTLWGFWKRWDEPFEVTVAADRRPKGIRTHRCNTLLTRDVTIIDGIQVTSAARTLLDMAPRTRSKSLTRYINDARRTHLLALKDLADVAARCPSHPGAPILNIHAATPHNPTRSWLEDKFLRFCERFDLPTPLINTVLYGYEVDAYFPVEKVIVEIDGGEFHKYTFERDREQDATMLLHGIVTIRVTDDRLTKTPGREADRLHAILRSRREGEA